MADCVERGVTSFKLYLAYPQLLQVDDDVVFDVLRACARHGGLVTVHCENGGAIEALRRRALAEGRTSVVSHRDCRLRRWRPRRQPGRAAGRGGGGAGVRRPPVVGAGAGRGAAAQERGVALHAETCPQYLTLDATVLEGPAARTSSARRPCGTRGTGRSCGRVWAGAGSDGGDRPLPVHRGRPGPGVAGRPEGCRLHRDPRRAPGGRPGSRWCGRGCGGADHGGRLVAAVRRGAGPDVRAVPPQGLPAPGGRRRRRGRRTDRPSRCRRPTCMRVDHSPYEGQVAQGSPASLVYCPRPGLVAGTAGSSASGLAAMSSGAPRT